MCNLSEIIATLSNDDGNSKDNVWLKMNLYFICESLSNLHVFSEFMALKTSSSKCVKSLFSSKEEIQKFRRLGSRCCFADDSNEMYRVWNTHTELLFCLLNLLFSGVLVAGVVWLRSLMSFLLPPQLHLKSEKVYTDDITQQKSMYFLCSKNNALILPCLLSTQLLYILLVQFSGQTVFYSPCLSRNYNVGIP